MWCKGNGAVEWTGEGAAESRAAGLLGKNFYPGHCRIAFHRNEVQQQFALGVRFQTRGLADDHIRLARLLYKVKVLEQNIPIARHIEYMSNRNPRLAGGRRRLIPIAVTHRKIQRY